MQSAWWRAWCARARGACTSSPPRSCSPRISSKVRVSLSYSTEHTSLGRKTNRKYVAENYTAQKLAQLYKWYLRNATFSQRTRPGIKIDPQTLAQIKYNMNIYTGRNTFSRPRRTRPPAVIVRYQKKWHSSVVIRPLYLPLTITTDSEWILDNVPPSYKAPLRGYCQIKCETHLFVNK